MCEFVLRWLLFLGVDIINAVRRQCVFVFVSHSFSYSHILSDAVCNHSTTCCGWLNYTFVYLLRLLIRSSPLQKPPLQQTVLAAIVPTKISYICLPRRSYRSMIFSYIKKVFWYSFRFRSRSNSMQSDSSTMVCLLSRAFSGIIPFLYPFICFRFVCFSIDMCVSLCVQLFYFCAHLFTLSLPPTNKQYDCE